MTKIVRGGQSGALDHINSSQSVFRTQIAALTDAVRQLGGAAEIGTGAVTNDPLSAPYVLYVNPFTGSDKFVSGNYSTSGDATQRIDLQRLECGYTEARPFKTINRAIIEAGIITAKSYYTSPLTNNDLVSIILMPGVTTIYNGNGAVSVSEWATNTVPTSAQLTEFNPNATGGLILPRGASLCGLDLRKTILRPDVVPAVADEAAYGANRRAIFKITGTGYYFGFTFLDKAGSTDSHHLLDCFQFASAAELDEFYTKIRQAFGGASNTGGIDNALAVTRTAEYEIVGPRPAAGSQTIATDTTLSASPYIFNCSIRSNYGLCGVYADGAITSGFRSMVIAQFTGVSLQRDLNCWQKYSGGAWGAFANYAEYINSSPDNVRMNPARRSVHIRAVNKAVIQEVSVFAIGQGVHHWTQTGGEITITNSNSNFGGCAAISDGYQASSFQSDVDWNVSYIRTANNLSTIANNVSRIYLGTVSAVTSSSVTLVNALGESTTIAGVPDLLARDGYTLRNSSYIWVENPLGRDWRTTVTASAWAAGTPAQLNTNAALIDEDGQVPGVNDVGVDRAVGKRVYVRRIVDTRTPEQRRFTLKLANTNGAARLPERDYVLQTTVGGAVVSEISSASALLVTNSGKALIDGVLVAAQLTLRRGNASVEWTSGTRYLRGDTVKRNNKHFSCVEANYDTTFDAAKWEESFVHMPSDYNPEDFYKSETPILTFDNDTSGNEDSTTLGYNFTTLWANDALIQAQYRNATDYRGIHLFLTAIGFTSNQAHTILTPKAEASRDLDPAVSGDMGGYVPSGAANALDNWAVEFRRPSVIRLFGHAWEWTGFLNYTKAIPGYQRQISLQNKFTYYFTNDNGGRVYATGFNEEGYQVTPRGLEDITTGEVLSVENLGSNDITLDTPTEFTNLTLNGTTIIKGALDLTGVNSGTFSSSLNALTTTSGVGYRAPKSALDTATTAPNDAAINAGLPYFVTPNGLIYLCDQRYAPLLTQSARRLYVLPSGAALPANASTYPLIEGGTVDLTQVTTYTTIQAAYASLPGQFLLPEGSHIDIYLLNATIPLGTFSGADSIGSANADRPTYIIPLNWNQNNVQQTISYTLASNYSSSYGPFNNVVFYTINAINVPVAVQGRVKLSITATPTPAGMDAHIICAVGRNIQSSNLLVELSLAPADVSRRTFVFFKGCNFTPFVTYYRHNERPIFLKVKLLGAGTQNLSGDANTIYHYDVAIFQAMKDCPVQYGAAMALTATIAGYTDANKRLSTGYFEFENARSNSARVLLNQIEPESILRVEGASYGSYSTNITWAFTGTSAWNWRFIGYPNPSSDSLAGTQNDKTKVLMLVTGVTSQSWGGFINSNSSTKAYSTVTTPGPFSTAICDLANWGVFGAGGNVSAADSLIGTDGTGYLIRANASLYNIVSPPN